MRKLKWLAGYTGQSTAKLLALEGKYRTDSIVLSFEQALEQKVDRVGLHNINEAEMIVLAVEALEREVNNGGYDQFFRNDSRQYVHFIVDALARIGADRAAEITKLALGALELRAPITAEAVEQRIAKADSDRDDALNECDSKYLIEAGDLSALLLEFIKKNAASVRIP